MNDSRSCSLVLFYVIAYIYMKNIYCLIKSILIVYFGTVEITDHFQAVILSSFLIVCTVYVFFIKIFIYIKLYNSNKL